MTPRPGRIKAVVDMPIARPRVPATLHRPEFIALKERCLELLAKGHEGELAGAATEENAAKKMKWAPN